MKHLKKFELFESKYADDIESLISAKEAAPLLKDMSGEELGFEEFVKYISDYYHHPNEYEIDVKDKYYQAIVSAYEIPKCEEDMLKFYNEYVKEFHPWKKSDQLNDFNDKTGVLEN